MLSKTTSNTLARKLKDSNLDIETLKERKKLRAVVQQALLDRTDAVVLVGSYARNASAGPTSDIDVLVIGGHRAETGPEGLHVMSLSAADLKKRVHAGDDFAQWALRFGLPLAGRRRWKEFAGDLLPNAPWPAYEQNVDRAIKDVARVIEFLEIGDLEAATEFARLGLSQIARAILLSRKVFPLSRQELTTQVAKIGEQQLGRLLEETIGAAELSRDCLRSICSFLQDKIRQLSNERERQRAER